MSLKNYFPPSQHSDKVEFEKLLDEIHHHQDFYSYIAHAKSGRYFHVSPSFTTITGYPVSEIETKGVGFYMDHVPMEDVMGVMETQGEHFAEASNRDFNHELPNFIEMKSRLQKPDGSYIFNIAQSIVLAYLSNGEIDFVIVAVYPPLPGEQSNPKIEKEVKELLINAKELFRKIYPQAPVIPSPVVLTEIVIEVDPSHILTPKEKEVLKLIAQGLSTKEIAINLGISENTIETHRKNMFSKFSVNNVAELIKKTSKLYWL